MRVVVLGAGGVGSVVAGYLARAGYDVVMIARPGHAAAVQQEGLRITGLEHFQVRAPALIDATDLRSADMLIITVKTSERALNAIEKGPGGAYAAEEFCVMLEKQKVNSLQGGCMKTSRSRRKATRGAAALALLFSTASVALAESTKDVLAKIGDHAITEADISNDIAGQMVRINNQIYSVKKQAVDAAIADYLMNQEAKKRNITREQLVKQEITDKTPAVTDAEVQQVYDANKARLGGKKLEEIKPQIVQQLQANKQQQRQQEFVQELKKEASVKMFLKPPVLNVATDGAPSRGPANAPVTIVEFSDFQ